MIASLVEVKTLIQESGTTKDSLITLLLPMLSNEIFEYCNNWFENTDIYLTDTFVFADTGNTITADFSEFYAVPGDLIHIKGSNYNDGVHKIETITSTVITITSDTEIKDETVENDYDVYMYKMEVPNDLKLILAKMVKFHIDLQASGASGVSSESIGSYSVSYVTDSGSTASAYPGYVTNALRKYTQVKCT